MEEAAQDRRDGKTLVEEIRDSSLQQPLLSACRWHLFWLKASCEKGNQDAWQVLSILLAVLHLVFCFRLFIAMWGFFPTVQCNTLEVVLLWISQKTVIFSLYYFFPSCYIETFYWLWSLSHSPAMLGQINFWGCLCKLRISFLTLCLEYSLSKNVVYI